MSLSPERPSSTHSIVSGGSILTGDYQPVPLSEIQSSHDHIISASDSNDTITGDQTSSTSGESAQGFPLRRFILRTLLLVLVPPLITAYFIVVCWVYRVPNPEINQYGHRNALWVYYSWFVIGVFGLGISKYGLSGIEAAMLQDRHWHARDAMTLLMHSGQSWSGPGGWIKCLGILVRKRKSPVHRLWWLLSSLSLMVTVALPMSGLSMELFDGFVQASRQPLVIGYFPETFNNKSGDLLDLHAWVRTWQVGRVSVDLPGAGIAYTPQGLDRSKYDYLTELPNSMSTEQDVPDLFLIPQARYPVSGRAWGLRLSYNCSVVRSVSELTILPRKNSLPIDSDWILSDMACMGTRTLASDRVCVYNTTHENLFAYVELGTRYHTNYTSEQDTRPEADILEYAMWQVRIIPEFDGVLVDYDGFNHTIAVPISGIGSPLIHANGTFTPNTTFLGIQQDTQGQVNSDELHKFFASGMTYGMPEFRDSASPIGVRCQARSDMGTATLNPDDMSFYDFIRVPPVEPKPGIYLGKSYGSPTPPFGDGVWTHLYRHRASAFTNVLDSVRTAGNDRTNIRSLIGYKSYFQAENLRKSLMRAFAVDAVQLMYDGRNTFEEAQIAENLTASQPGKILGPGAVPAHVPAVMFGIWATGCVILGLGYGFRCRWAETLDGYSFLRFGADYADEINVGDWSGLMSHGAAFHRNGKLVELPGLIGDEHFHRKIGRISLVEPGRYARRNKLYA